MKHMDVFIRGVYYILNVVANLVSAHRMGLCGYRGGAMNENLNIPITDSKGELAGHAVSMESLYIIHTCRQPQHHLNPHNLFVNAVTNNSLIC